MKIFVVLLLLYSSIWAAKIDDFAQKNHYFRDYNSALAVAYLSNKMIMLVIVADFCPWCKKFERKILANKDVSALVTHEFMPIIVDNYRDIGHFPNTLKTKKLPIVYFINPKTQKIIKKSSLYVKKSEFLKTLKEAINIFEENNK